jgi:aminoglycoside phosphotransferase (APT) family kinase protein
VPRVHLPAVGSLGVPFFIMQRVDGETIARKILRDAEYARARAGLVQQLGAALAKIHSIDVNLPALQALQGPPAGSSPAEHEVTRFEAVYRAITPDPHPAFELAFRWLRRHAPAASKRCFVHGDYRMGNMIVGPEGLRAVLDWELAHIGDPMEDLGWLCVRSWRFGEDTKVAGGIGSRAALFAAYEAGGGGKVDPDSVRWWEAFGNLRWGIICISQTKAYLDGHSRSVELASIGRRVAETEWELLQLMEA